MTSRNQRKKQNARKRSEHVRNAGPHDGGTAGGVDHGVDGHGTHPSDETEPALRTTELVAYAATVLAVVLTALALDADGEGGQDPFGAETAVRYITYLTIGYLLARGLAKSGSRRTRPVSHHDDHDHDHDHVGHDDGDDHVVDLDRDHASGTPSPAHEDDHVVTTGGAAHRP